MKKAILALSAASLLLCVTTISVSAQENDIAVDKKMFSGEIGSNSKKVAAEEINTKAIKNFEKTVKQAQNVSWYKDPDGFMVYYYQGTQKNVSGYDVKGNWMYNTVSYKEDKMPKSVYHQVKSVYYDYAIVWVNEIQLARKTIYIVHLEDSKSYKNVRISDDEMDVVEEVLKN